MMIFQDPPRHDRLRKLVSRAFTPRRVAGLEPFVREELRSKAFAPPLAEVASRLDPDGHPVAIDELVYFG